MKMETKKAFTKFHDEGIIIGRLLASYAELELCLLHCVNVARDDFDTVYKTMFRERGELRRINMADILGRQKYHELGLGTQFEMALSSIHFCRKVRNQYAHCTWYDDFTGLLAFVNLEKGAESNKPVKDFKKLTILHIDIPTLILQEQFFEYTNALLVWLNFEGRRIAGKLSRPQELAPKHLKQPPLHIPT